jgi:ABC-type spermidine/putrescine transport system permease subunit II
MITLHRAADRTLLLLGRALLVVTTIFLSGPALIVVVASFSTASYLQYCLSG